MRIVVSVDALTVLSSRIRAARNELARDQRPSPGDLGFPEVVDAVQDFESSWRKRPNGTYFGEADDSFGQRSLPVDRLNVERLDRDVDVHRAQAEGVRVQQSKIAEAFGQPGGGTQYQFLGPDGTPLSQAELVRLGIIREAVR